MNRKYVRSIADEAVAAALDAALGEVCRQGGPDYLLLEARGCGMYAAIEVLRARGVAPPAKTAID